MAHAKDPQHWLYRFTPREWIQAALAELGRAEVAFENKDRKGALACCRRAAGMAINGALAAADATDERYGRSYMDHLIALANDERAPQAVRDAAKLLVDTPLPGSTVVMLRTAGTDERLVDAARDVMAHAYAMVMRSEP
jgi:hypothetical protein